jgi:hypothetical protein
MAPRTSYPLPAQHPFGGMDAWRLLSLRAAASPEKPFLTTITDNSGGAG